MIERVVEIEGTGRFLSRDRGFLVISEGAAELGRIPLDDIAVVLVHAHGVTYTNELVVALAERCVPLIVCNRKHFPVGMFLPYSGNHLLAERLSIQVAASLPRKKRLWQALVRGKIEMQANLLQHVGENPNRLRALAKKVRSGDPENTEAQAARLYWPLLMGSDFRRRRNGGDGNPLLNYGYTILRSAVARSVLKAGLNPALGLHHKRADNPFALVDDLMEPLRPTVDRIAHDLTSRGQSEICRETKQALASVLVQDLLTEEGRTIVARSADRLAFSLVQSLTEKRDLLRLPIGFPSMQSVRSMTAESEVA